MAKVAAEVGSTANRYQIFAKLAVGGMAEIFLARGASVAGVERYCVLKRILRERATDAQFVRMFVDEARLAAQLQHPNIASVYDIGMLGDSYFFTMEYVHGETVRSLLQRSHTVGRQLPLACVMTVIAGAASGLHHAHGRNANDGRPLGIVHRDVSPSNLMVSFEGNTKLVDFGVAKAADRAVETQSGTVKGKISYLSPEQCRGTRVDRRSDLFSLGIVMWEMLTGARLYRRPSDFENMTAIVHEPAPRPSTRRPDIPRAIDDIVMKLLAKDLADRYQTADEVVEAIENASMRAGTILSTSAVSRLMRDLFGTRLEPWLELDLDTVPHDAATLMSKPIPPSTGAEPDDQVDAPVDAELANVPDISSASMNVETDQRELEHGDEHEHDHDDHGHGPATAPTPRVSPANLAAARPSGPIPTTQRDPRASIERASIERPSAIDASHATPTTPVPGSLMMPPPPPAPPLPADPRVAAATTVRFSRDMEIAGLPRGPRAPSNPGLPVMPSRAPSDPAIATTPIATPRGVRSPSDPALTAHPPVGLHARRAPTDAPAEIHGPGSGPLRAIQGPGSGPVRAIQGPGSAPVQNRPLERGVENAPTTRLSPAELLAGSAPAAGSRPHAKSSSNSTLLGVGPRSTPPAGEYSTIFTPSGAPPSRPPSQFSQYPYPGNPMPPPPELATASDLIPLPDGFAPRPAPAAAAPVSKALVALIAVAVVIVGLAIWLGTHQTQPAPSPPAQVEPSAHPAGPPPTAPRADPPPAKPSTPTAGDSSTAPVRTLNDELLELSDNHHYEQMLDKCSNAPVDPDTARLCIMAACNLRNRSVASQWLATLAPAERAKRIAECNQSAHFNLIPVVVPKHTCQDDPRYCR